MKIGIIGATGRMGLSIMEEIAKDDGLELVSGFARYEDKNSGVDLGELAFNKKNGILTSANLEEVIAAADSIIDFSSIELTLQAAEIASKLGKTYVCGTTGFNEEQFSKFQSFANNSAFLWSSNMSIGINLLTALIKQACKTLDSDFDTEIIEMHHRYKKDAPSGTAISLGKAIAEAKGLDFDKVAQLSREGIIEPRAKDEIGFATLRGGSVIGDHTVIFAEDNERIELSHKAVSRNIFAKGALRAAKWSNSKEPGLYSIQDMF